MLVTNVCLTDIFFKPVIFLESWSEHTTEADWLCCGCDQIERSQPAIQPGIAPPEMLWVQAVNQKHHTIPQILAGQLCVLLRMKWSGIHLSMPRFADIALDSLCNPPTLLDTICFAFHFSALLVLIVKRQRNAVWLFEVWGGWWDQGHWMR